MNKNQIENLKRLNREFEQKLKEDALRRKKARININFSKIKISIKKRKIERSN